MAASSRKQKSGKAPRKRDLSLNIDTPFGKANLNYKKSGAIRESISVPVSQGTRTKSIGQKFKVNGRTETVEGSGTFLTIPTAPDETDHGLSAPVNPGLSEFFPWLSKSASQFSRYMFNRLIFTFISRVPTTSVGDMLLMGDPNVQNSLPATFVDAVSYEGAVFGNVWTRLVYDARLFCNQPKYVRLGPLAEGQDSKTYDCGVLGYLISGFTSSLSVGYITVDYSVTFMDRRIPPDKGCYVTVYPMPFDAFGPSILALFEVPNPNPIVQTYVGAEGTYLGFPKGLWLVNFSYVPNNTVNHVPNFSVPPMETLKMGYRLGLDTPDVCRLLTREDTPLGLPFGTESSLVSGLQVDVGPSILTTSQGTASSYYAVLANSGAVPIISAFPSDKPPSGWISCELFPYSWGSSSGFTDVTCVICRLPDSYGPYLGFEPGVPIVTPMVVSELRCLRRKFKIKPSIKAREDLNHISRGKP